MSAEERPIYDGWDQYKGGAVADGLDYISELGLGSFFCSNARSQVEVF